MKAAALALAIGALAIAQPPAVVMWRLDNLATVESNRVEMIGAPVVVSTSIGPALEFNGASDALLIDRNPIEGLRQFTIEVLFAADRDGPVEQRFFHAQESASEN